MKDILIIEDDLKIARFLELELKHEGFNVTKSHDGREGVDLAVQNAFDLIILDLMLPRLNGMEVCRRIRLNRSTPIIMLTAKDDTMNKVMGLDLGADDYMTKPFAIEELLARIRKIFRTTSSSEEASLSPNTLLIGQLSIDKDAHEVTLNGDRIELTRTEYDLLLFLSENQNRAVSREEILSQVWGYENELETKVVDVYIRYLRTKIDERFGLKYIHTIRGVGYCLKYENHN